MSEMLLPSSPQLMPIPLPDDKPPVMDLPMEALPGCLRAYVEDVANRQQCPPDFVAVTALCGLSAALGNKAIICPKQHDDWEVVPNLWGAVIGRPSAMKSPAMKSALAPLHAIQDERRADYEHDILEHNAAAELYDIETKHAKDIAKKELKKGNRDVAKAALRESTEQPKPPTRPRLIVNDATVEKLGELLNENPAGLLLERDELAGWLAKLRGEDGQSDRAFYLQCFDGNGRFTFDRIGRGTVEIESTTLSVIGGIQPTKIAPLIRAAVNGHDNDGLVQRLQLAVWPDDINKWKWRDQAPNPQARAAYDAAFRELADLAPSETPYRFSPSAQALFIEWMEETQNHARSGVVHPAMESHLIKMPQTVAALALIFELVDRQGETVGETATAMALDFSEYLKSHAERLYSVANNAAITGAKLILNRRDKLPIPITLRTIHQKGWAGLTEHQDVRDALDLLLDYRYLIAVTLTDTGGRPTTKYYWNGEC